MPNQAPQASELECTDARAMSLVQAHRAPGIRRQGTWRGRAWWASLSLGEGAGETGVFPQQRAGQGGLPRELRCRLAQRSLTFAGF